MAQIIKTYIGTKIIQAVPMSHHDFLRANKNMDRDTLENQEDRPGYRVTYPDNYISWSPKDVFETAYREVTAAEAEFF